MWEFALQFLESREHGRCSRPGIGCRVPDKADSRWRCCNGDGADGYWDMMVNVLECYHVCVEDMVQDMEQLYTDAHDSIRHP